MKRRRALASLIGGVVLGATATAVPAAADPLDFDLDFTDTTSPFDALFYGDSETDAYSAFEDYSFDDFDVDFGLDDYSFDVDVDVDFGLDDYSFDDDLDVGLDDSYSIDPAWGDDWTSSDIFDVDLNLDDSYALSGSKAAVASEDFPFVPADCIFRGQIDGHKEAARMADADAQQVDFAKDGQITESKGMNQYYSEWAGRLGRPAHLDDDDLNPLAGADHIAENIWNLFQMEMITNVEPATTGLDHVIAEELQHVFGMNGRPAFVEVKACVKNEATQEVGLVDRAYSVRGPLNARERSSQKSKCDLYQTFEGVVESDVGPNTTKFTENNFWIKVFTAKRRSNKRPRYETTPNPKWPYNPPPPAAGGGGGAVGVTPVGGGSSGGGVVGIPPAGFCY